jgi:hypothetical protein
MTWREELDALVKETMTLAETAKAPASLPKPVVPLELIELAFKETTPPASIRASEREHVRERVADFKKHQERLRREREDYYARTMSRARRLADGIADESADC